MSKIKIGILFILIANSGFAQLSFYERGKKQIPLVDTLIPLESQKTTNDKFDFYSDSLTVLLLQFNQLLLEEVKNKADTLKQSVALTKLATFSTISRRSLLAIDSKNRVRKTKPIQQILFNCKKSFGLVSVHSITIPIVKRKWNFFYDKDGPDGGFNLYKGNQPSKKEVEEGYEYIPLELYTYQEITDLLRRQLYHSTILKTFKKRRTCAVGYHFFLDKKSVNRNKIPEIKGLVILGHKRLPKPKKMKPI